MMPQSHDYAVDVNNLSVKFDDFYAVNNISFSVRKGEIFGFLGANGAGKTTTIRVLCGLLHPSEGKVKVGGVEFLSEAAEMEIKRKVGYMSQKFTLYNDLTVEENLSFIADLRNLSKAIYLKRRADILEFITFRQPLNAFVRDLPGGIKQQVSLAAAILHDPEIIFLDEPTAGVTPAMRAKFWSLIAELAALKKTIFVTTHYMDEAENCERIALMKTGQIVALGSPQQLKKETFHEKIYELNPRYEFPYARIGELRAHPEFSFFEPYGMRFHVSLKKSANIEKLRKSIEADFEIQEIEPSLEDVFIKTIEEKEK